MKRAIVLLGFFCIIFSCKGSEYLKNTGKLSIIFPVEKIGNYQIIKEMKKEFTFKQYVSDINTEGLPQDVLIFDILSERLAYYNLEYADVRESVDAEFSEPLPYVENRELSQLIFDLRELQEMNKFNDIDLFERIVVKSEGSNGKVISLGEVVSISVSVIPNRIFYNNEEVYKINIDYNQKNFKELLEDCQFIGHLYDGEYKLIAIE